jgi:WD40 repeat protein
MAMFQTGSNGWRKFLLVACGLALLGAVCLNRPARSQDPGAQKPKQPPPQAAEIGLPPPLDGKEKPILVTDAAGHSAMVRAAFFHPNGENVVTVSMDKTVRLWDLASGESLMTLRLPTGHGDEGALFAGAMSPDGRWLAVSGMPFGLGRLGYPIYLVAIEKGVVDFTFKGHKNAVVSLAFSHDGRTLASAANDGTARLYDLQNRKTTHILQGHTQHLRQIAFSHDDKYVATSARDGSIRIWSVADGDQVVVLNDFPADPISVAWHPKEHTLATGCADGFFQLWGVDGKRKKNFQLESKVAVVALAFSPEGQEILWGGLCLRDRCGIFNFKDEKTRLVFKENTNTVFQGGYSADGKLAITTGGNDHETFVWNTDDGSVVQKLQGAGRSVWEIFPDRLHRPDHFALGRGPR